MSVEIPYSDRVESLKINLSISSKQIVVKNLTLAQDRNLHVISYLSFVIRLFPFYRRKKPSIVNLQNHYFQKYPSFRIISIFCNSTSMSGLMKTLSKAFYKIKILG